MLKKVSIITATLIIFLGLSITYHTKANTNVAYGSTIAGISMEGLTLKEAKDSLELEIKQWKSSGDLAVLGDYEKLTIPRSIFTFDIDSSYRTLQKQTDKKWYKFFSKDKKVELPLTVAADQNAEELADWPDYVDKQAVLNKAKKVASYLKESNVSVAYDDNVERTLKTISEVSLDIGDVSKAVIDYDVDKLNEQVIDPEDKFSFLKAIDLPDDLNDGSTGSSFVASALYALALETNIQFIDRFSQGQVPENLDMGVEVLVSPKQEKDFVLYNPNNTAYVIAAELDGDTLNMKLQSYVEPKEEFRYDVKDKKEIDPRTIYRYSDLVNPGGSVVIESGRKGYQVSTYRKGSETDNELVDRTFYTPIPQIVLLSTQPEPEGDGDDNSSDSNGSNGNNGNNLDNQINGDSGNLGNIGNGNNSDGQTSTPPDGIDYAGTATVIQDILNQLKESDEPFVCAENSEIGGNSKDGVICIQRPTPLTEQTFYDKLDYVLDKVLDKFADAPQKSQQSKKD